MTISILHLTRSLLRIDVENHILNLSGAKAYTLNVGDFTPYENWPIAFHGTNKEGVFGIELHGFSIKKIIHGRSYGNGVYLLSHICSSIIF